VADSMSPKRLKISEDYATRLIQSFSKEEDKAQYIAEL
jgi:hypothetical protein